MTSPIPILLADDPDRLYSLLPAVYREADAAQGYPLRALMRLIGDQADMLREDVEALLDDYFVETSRRSMVPYIGELIGNELLHDIELAPAASTAEALFPDLAGPNLRPIAAIRTRADVAKTIYYRRRKGTLAVIEELARDVTGWPAHAVAFFERLNWTQNLNHLRLASTDAPLLRAIDIGQRVQGPFDEASHTVDVRRISTDEGWYNIRNVGLFLWRLRSYPVEGVVARPIGGSSWRLTFSPLGNSTPLFSHGVREGDETALAREINVPAPIRSEAFHDDLRRLTSTSTHGDYYGDPSIYSAWSVAVKVGGTLVPPQKIRCLNLRNWSTATQPAGVADQDKVGIDVRRGRLILGSSFTGGAPPEVRVWYHYGFSADLGGGPYERGKWLVSRRLVTQSLIVGAGATYPTLDAALAFWRLNASRDTVITIRDSGSYAISAPLDLDASAWLVIQAANGARPHIQPDKATLIIDGTGNGSELTLSGLLVEGAVLVKQNIRRLRLIHTTLVPGRRIAEEQPTAPAPPRGPSLDVTEMVGITPINTQLRVEIAYSITGPLRIPSHATGLWLLDSIVDSTESVTMPPPTPPLPRVSRVTAICNAAGTNGPAATIERSTILGAAFFVRLPLASDSIFTDAVTVEREQDGCVRFSFVPGNSVTPQQYRCQPSMTPGASSWLVPSFGSVDYGHPRYAQLRPGTPREILAGADDGAEMGAFNHLKQPQRETNLRIRLDEYLPFGLDAGLIYVT